MASVFLMAAASMEMRICFFATLASVNPGKQLHIPAELNPEIANQFKNFFEGNWYWKIARIVEGLLKTSFITEQN
jgi:hypothetical protein